MKRRTGRRPGVSGTREAIASAATRLFSELGYDRTSLRAIAAEAGVDPALVVHYFGSKQQLFIAVVELPFEPGAVLPRLLAGERGQIGERLAGFVLSVLDDPASRARLVGMVRAAASEPRAAAMLRDLISRELLRPIAENLDAENAGLRASLAGSQVVGLLMARHVVGVEPLASTESATVAAALAPTFQRYLAEPLS